MGQPNSSFKNKSHLHGLAIYVKEGPCFACDLNNSYLRYQFASFLSVSYVFFFNGSLISIFFVQFFLCSFIKHREGFLDQSLFNIFVFGDVGGPLERWSTYYSGTDTSGELYNFSILSGLTKIINYPTCITNGEAHSPAF